MKSFDAIVVGVGGMGSAALFHLAQRGLRVLGIEAFGVPNDRGSSHGETRIIRKAYFEHPDYVPLLVEAYALWRDLETRAGCRLFHRTGLLEVSEPGGMVVAGAKRSAEMHEVPIEIIPISEVASRFRGFRPAEHMEAVYEADAGYLPVERCVQIHAEEAKSLGARVVTNESVLSWEAGPNGVSVVSASQKYSASALVFCSGAWTYGLLQSLRMPLEIWRQPVLWYQTKPGAYRVENGSPVFCFDTADGFYYGFPALDGDQIKVARHGGGQVVARPEEIDRELHSDDEFPVLRFICAHMPDVLPVLRKHSICMYTMTPDQHFVIGTHPDHAQVVFAGGFSGHGFKFAPIIGSVLADLVTTGRTAVPIGFLSPFRAALNVSG